ncbi:hypothetical protein CK203_094573 [Vitis vinifera]|uniref:Uncharacterized protein n=1 Tax=Vitis vinifera TaxID=29760 RepID=A0A438CJP2_VITVI|nr:hypothetical protein CK203_094573 [Vitis vinifera]
MDDLFKQVDKYSMLEDNVWTATQQVLVTNRLTKDDKVESSKSSNQSRQASKRQASQQHLQADELLTICPKEPRAFSVWIQWRYDDFSRMKVIHFTYHQKVSYLIEEGQVDLLGSQLVPCQCYQVALDSGHPTDEKAHME